jgi:tetratricopeptide (TPR) repeat protein
MRRSLIGAVCLGLLTLAGPTGPDPLLAQESIPLYQDFGVHHREISTSSAEAQAFFDQGLMLAYAFGRPEAVSSFRTAVERDPECAICSWGEAWALGPYINSEMDDGPAAEAYAAIQRALEHIDGATEAEEALIEAMATRYAEDPESADRKKLDRTYADAMRAVAERFPDDQDIGALFGEALMVLYPWDLYPNGQERPETTEAVQVLEGVLDRNLEHGGACHLYIHAVEASTEPGRAEACADVLAGAIPGGSHIHHMPSHIYMRIGRYEDSVRANQDAWLRDQMAERGEAVAIYPGHNLHMLWFAAWMDGQSAVALQAARDMERTGHWAFGIRPLTLARFGRWDEVLETEKPDDSLHEGMWHFARGLAYLRTGDDARAARALKRLDKITAKTDPADTFFDGTDDGPIDFLRIAQGMLAAEIAAADGDFDEAIDLLKEVAATEDLLEYSEPEIWPIPARQVLGAIYLEAGMLDDAQRVYEEELDKHPGNGWSLFGLAQVLREKGEDELAEEVDARFEQAWERSDLLLSGSRF